MMNLAQESYQDYRLKLNMENELQVVDLKLEPKKVTLKTGEDRLLLHISGTQVSTGLIVNMDIWPRNEVSDEQMEEILKADITDAIVRIGVWTELDNDLKPVMRVGKPKWMSLFSGANEIVPDGDKIEFVEQ